MKNDGLLDLFKRLWNQLSKDKKHSFFILLFLMLINGFAELMSIGMLLPFMGIILSPEKIVNNETVVSLFNKFNLNDTSQYVLYITIIFILVTFLSGLVRYTLLRYNSKFTFSCSSELSTKIYKNSLNKTYEEHLNMNSSEIIDGITQKINGVIYGAVQPFLALLTSILVGSFIFTLLLFVNFKAMIFSMVTFIVIYGSIIIKLKNKIRKLSVVFPKKSTEAVKVVQEGLGNIRDIIIDNVQNIYVNKFKEADEAYKDAQKLSMIYSGSPKIFIDVLLITFISIFLYLLSNTKVSIMEIMPIMSVFILGAQRLLPLIQNAYSSYTNIQAARFCIVDVLKLMEEVHEIKREMIEDNKMIEYREKIFLEKLSFKYNNSQKNTIDNLSLIIEKGMKIGIIGDSGSGKSTLMDILMGLLSPQDGSYFIDNQLLNKDSIKSWQKKISHVPQSIYLADTTIYENIAFGLEYKNIDKQKVLEVIKKVKLENVVSSMERGCDTVVGERGAKLSGGQRQRIGIARALYKNADILFLDEATSALDNETESSIMNVLDGLEGITVIMIAHRLSTLRNCDRIIKLDKGKIIKIVSYEEIIQSSKEVKHGSS